MKEHASKEWKTFPCKLIAHRNIDGKTFAHGGFKNMTDISNASDLFLNKAAQIFLKAAQTSSFTEAGERFGMTQSAVSRIIKHWVLFKMHIPKQVDKNAPGPAYRI